MKLPFSRFVAVIAALTVAASAPPALAKPVTALAPQQDVPLLGHTFAAICRDNPRIAKLRFADGRSFRLCIGRLFGRGWLVVVPEASGVPPVAPMEVNTANALAILADTRLETLWPDVEAMLGPDGRSLADAEVRRTSGNMVSRAARDPLESLSQGQTRVLMDRATALNDVGQVSEAIALLEGRRQLLLAPALRRLDPDTQFDAISIVLRMARFQVSSGDTAGALATLAAAESDNRISSDYRLNPATNRAAILAENGQARDALRLIDRVIAQWRGPQRSDESITGSERQFAWIRGCTLHQLGRTQEANRELDVVRNAPDTVPSDWGMATPATFGIAFRAALCVGDANWAADLMKAGASRYPHPFALELQPARPAFNPRQAATLQAARALVAARNGAPTVRILPDQYRAALSNFRHTTDYVDSPAAQ